jgi:V8-like Glu-specific endopeptidase
MKLIGFLAFIAFSFNSQSWAENDNRIQIKEVKSKLSSFEKQDRDLVRMNQIGQRVGLIRSWDDNMGGQIQQCSATLIHEGDIITAAHCVYNVCTGKPFENVVFLPRSVGADKSSKSRVFIQKAFVLSKYIEIANKNKSCNASTTQDMRRNDIAILKTYSDRLKKPTGRAYGYFGFTSLDQELKKKALGSMEPLEISFASYPLGKPEGTLWYEKCELWKDDFNNVVSNCRSNTGSSGAAALVEYKDEKLGFSYRVVGVHSSAANSIRLGLFAPITEEIQSDIFSIMRGSKTTKHFTEISFKTQKAFYVHVNNKCKKPINVKIIIDEPSISLFELDNLAPGTRTWDTPPLDINHWYYRATDIYGNLIPSKNSKEVANSEYFFVNGKELLFYKKTIKRHTDGTKKWGDYKRHIVCD